MKILSRMLSKKINPGKVPVPPEHDVAAEASARQEQPLADDSGKVNPSRVVSRRTVDADPAAPITPKAEEPEVAASGWAEDDWDDENWDDDEDWGEEEFDMETRRRTADKKQLVSEIRDAMDAAKRVRSEPPVESAADDSDADWSEDKEFGRKAIARSELTNPENEDRILEKTETAMTDRETSRRRSAMAHLKAAAAATKADRVLRHVVSRDPSADPEEQSPYRDDLAKVVRPHSTSRPISRVVSRPSTRSPIWDQGAGDDDAALFAAAEDNMMEDPAVSVEDEMAAAEAERIARSPSDMSEEDFSNDGLKSAATGNGSFPSSPFARQASESAPQSQNAFEDIDEDDFDDFDDDDDFSPRPSRVVSEAVAFANAPDEEVDTSPPETEVRKKIWEVTDEVASEIEKTKGEPENFAEVATAVSGRAGRSSGGRVKTRLLGFQTGDESTSDVFEAEKPTAPSGQSQYPAGWIVVVDGPGRGTSFTLHSGVSQIGRGEEQAVRLDFGDTSISRNNHAAVAYDDEQGKFFLGHGGKSNLVRLNDMPVLSTEELTNGDKIRIGETTLRFVALCGEEFTWASSGDAAAE